MEGVLHSSCIAFLLNMILVIVEYLKKPFSKQITTAEYTYFVMRLMHTMAQHSRTPRLADGPLLSFSSGLRRFLIKPHPLIWPISVLSNQAERDKAAGVAFGWKLNPRIFRGTGLDTPGLEEIWRRTSLIRAVSTNNGSTGRWIRHIEIIPRWRRFFWPHVRIHPTSFTFTMWWKGMKDFVPTLPSIQLNFFFFNFFFKYTLVTALIGKADIRLTLRKITACAVANALNIAEGDMFPCAPSRLDALTKCRSILRRRKCWGCCCTYRWLQEPCSSHLLDVVDSVFCHFKKDLKWLN